MPNSRTMDANDHARLKRIEERLARIEEKLGLAQTEEDDVRMPRFAARSVEEESRSVEDEAGKETIEYQIGFYWFAKFGIVILAVGIAFLLTFPYQNIPGYLPSLLGFVLSAGLLASSTMLSKSYDLVSRYTFGSGLVLCFFSVLRLHFFSPLPFIESRPAVVLLLCFVVVGNLIMSVRRSSPSLAAMGLIAGYTTAMVSDAPYFMFSAITALSCVALYFRLVQRWTHVFLFAIVMSYFTHLLWLINNPLVGNAMLLNTTHPTNVVFVLVYLVVFAFGALFREKGEPERGVVEASSFLNCVLGFGMFVVSAEAAVEGNAAMACVGASIVFLSISSWFWIREKSKYSTFFYSMTGYLALSVAILLRSRIPDTFIWLSWQSVLVLATAIYFRSRFIVVANFAFYILLLLSYLVSASAVGAISLSFGAIALISARILNSQKHRLEIKTEMLRFTYLGAAFVIFPYALYYTVPEGYVPLSWMGVALFYYIMHRILKNQRYQLMALLTLSLTVVYVAIIGIVRLEPALRIVSFLALGTVLLSVSIIYSKIRRNQNALKDSIKPSPQR
jgi:uncharacterized membrane protein